VKKKKIRGAAPTGLREDRKSKRHFRPAAATALVPYGVSLSAVVPLLAALLSIPLGHRYPPLALPADEQKRQPLAAIRGLVQTLAAHQPVVLILEDLHWVDPSTLELLQGLVAQAPTTRLYVLVTARPEFQVAWPRQAHLSVLTLNRLLQVQVEVLVQQIAGHKALPAAVMQQIVTQSEACSSL
jgi:predicted ATPase